MVPCIHDIWYRWQASVDWNSIAKNVSNCFDIYIYIWIIISKPIRIPLRCSRMDTVFLLTNPPGARQVSWKKTASCNSDTFTKNFLKTYIKGGDYLNQRYSCVNFESVYKLVIVIFPWHFVEQISEDTALIWLAQLMRVCTRVTMTLWADDFYRLL